MKKSTIYLLFFILLFSTCKMKNESQIETNDNAKPLTSAKKTIVIYATKDAQYLVDAYSKGLYAVRAAELIKQNSNHKEVRAFAEKIANTHTQIIENIDELASNKKISLPSNLNQVQLNELRKLNESDPISLEKEFVRQMELEHLENMEVLEKISKESVDNEISTVAIAFLSTIKTQYEEVRSMKKQLEM